MEFEINMYTLLYLKWITSKALPYSPEKFTHCYMAAWMTGEFGREWMHMPESLCCPSETITTLLTGYTLK